MRVFPVRHHSPAAALLVDRLIRETRPRVVLIEGPSDADPLIDLLLDPDTSPPVAIYAYRTGQQVQSIFYPFCDYAPEYVALRAARAVGARTGFCDLPTRAMLDAEHQGAVAQALDEAAPDHRQALARAAGFDDFEAFWEAAFEQDAAAGEVADYVNAMDTYGASLRTLDDAAELARNEARERHMAAVARAVLADGVAEDDLLLVCGAFHVQGIRRFFREESGPPHVPEAAPAETVLIPYSFPRLSEQAGYGAGNRAPWYYQQVWERSGDYAAATRHALLAVMHHLQRTGTLASLAQAIDAETLARQLTALRGKRAPGADELVDAATSCFGYGAPSVVQTALQAVLIGDSVGRLTPRIGRTPLQQEFYATAQELGLPLRDAPRDVLVHLPQPLEARQSIFLHRLRVAEVPFGRQLEGGLGGGMDARGGVLGSLARVREKWQLQWTPDTDARLIERTAWGSTFEEVCTRLLGERLRQASRIDQGSEVLLELALCALVEPFDAAIDRCEQLAGDSASFVALAHATYHLDGLLSYGAARVLPVERLSLLAGRLFDRAVVHLPGAAVCGDEDAAALRERLVALQELVHRSSPAVEDGEAFWRALDRVAVQPNSHPGVRGLALVLLELGGRLPAGELTRRLCYWLGRAEEPRDTAQMVAALFSLHRATLLRNAELVGAVTDFLLDLDVDALTPLLPVLRGGFGALASRERDALSETLGMVLGITAETAQRSLSVSDEDLVRVRAANAAVAETLEEWSTAYGIP